MEGQRGSGASGALGGPVALATTDPDEVLVPLEATAVAREDLRLLEACIASAPTPTAAALTGPPPGGPHGAGPELQRLRALYLLAVDDRESLRSAWAIHGALSNQAWGRTEVGSAILEAYRGALLALDAKHGFWPHARVRDLRRGLEILDTQVTRAPDHEEVRYLRLLSTAFLPGFMGRRESAEADLERLAHLLPRAAHVYPQRTWTLMADTVEGLLGAHDTRLAREVAPAFRAARAEARAAGIPLVAGCRAG